MTCVIIASLAAWIALLTICYWAHSDYQLKHDTGIAILEERDRCSCVVTAMSYTATTTQELLLLSEIQKKILEPVEYN